jgi:hypothetical protein
MQQSSNARLLDLSNGHPSTFSSASRFIPKDPGIAGLREELQALGVQLTTSTPYNHEQNVFAE